MTDRPIAVFVSFIALLMLGVTAFMKLPISLLPNVDIPIVFVRINAPNLSSQETEERVTKPLRNSLQQLKGLKDVESVSSEGYGSIRLSFDHGHDISMAFIEVNEKIDMTMNSFANDIPRPQAVKSTVSDIPVFRLNIYPKDKGFSTMGFPELSSFSREVIRRRIEQIPEVAMVDMTGFMQFQVEVTPKYGFLETMGIRGESLLAAFRENTISLGSVLVSDGHYRYYLRFSGELQTLDALKQTPININGRLFTLADIAEINFNAEQTDGFYQSKKNQAINLAIIKQSAARMEDLEAHFQDMVEHMERDYPDISFEITQDQTKILNTTINNLQQDLLLGGFFAFILMLIFIREIRSAILIGITIPLSLMISQLGFFLFGLSLNIISLGGLILGLSMIIDNSIVVIDSITMYRKQGFTVKESATLGTNEVIRPLITSVLTNCAVFIPLIFLSGLAGSIFFDQAISIVLGVTSSLIVAILLLPALYTLLHKNQEVHTSFELRSLIDITTIYDRTLKWFFKFPYILTSIIILLIIGGILIFNKMDKSRLPEITRNNFEVFIDWNEYLDIEENKNRILSISDIFGDNLIAMNTWAGPQQYLLPIMEDLSYTQNRVYFEAHSPHTIDHIKLKLLSYIRQEYPLALVTFQPAQNAFDAIFADNSPPLTLKVSNKNDRKMPSPAKISTLVDTIESFLPSINFNPIALHEKITLEIDHQTAIRYGISSRQISNTMESILKNQKISDFQSSTSLVPLVLREERPHSIYNMLNERFVSNAAKEQIPLSSLVFQSSESTYKYVYAGSTGQYYPIDIYTNQPDRDLKAIKTALLNVNDMDLEINIEGSYFENKKLIKDMAIILIVSILLLYFILAAQFESLIQPLFILLELPIALFGAFILIYIGNNTLNLMSMIGIVVMSGLIINDSILKIDAINQLRVKGVPLMQAIFEGGHKRIRPIIMITLTSIGALFPTLFMHDIGSEIQKPLALALIGGMVVGLFISLFLVPIVYWNIYKRAEENA